MARTPYENHRELLDQMAKSAGFTSAQIRGSSRQSRIVMTRWGIASALHRKGLNSVQIATVMNRDPSSVRYALRRAG